MEYNNGRHCEDFSFTTVTRNYFHQYQHLRPQCISLPNTDQFQSNIKKSSAVSTNLKNDQNVSTSNFDSIPMISRSKNAIHKSLIKSASVNHDGATAQKSALFKTVITLGTELDQESTNNSPENNGFKRDEFKDGLRGTFRRRYSTVLKLVDSGDTICTNRADLCSDDDFTSSSLTNSNENNYTLDRKNSLNLENDLNRHSRCSDGKVSNEVGNRPKGGIFTSSVIKDKHGMSNDGLLTDSKAINCSGDAKFINCVLQHSTNTSECSNDSNSSSRILTSLGDEFSSHTVKKKCSDPNGVDSLGRGNDNNRSFSSVDSDYCSSTSSDEDRSKIRLCTSITTETSSVNNSTVSVSVPVHEADSHCATSEKDQRLVLNNEIFLPKCKQLCENDAIGCGNLLMCSKCVDKFRDILALNGNLDELLLWNELGFCRACHISMKSLPTSGSKDNSAEKMKLLQLARCSSVPLTSGFVESEDLVHLDNERVDQAESLDFVPPLIRLERLRNVSRKLSHRRLHRRKEKPAQDPCKVRSRFASWDLR